MLTRLILLLVIKQTLSRPADSTSDNVQSDNNKLFYTGDDFKDLETIESRELNSISSEARGFLSNLLGSSGTSGSQKPSQPADGSETPNKPSNQQSATIISANTYPVGAKPASSSKPGTGQEKPTESTSQGPSPVTSPPSQSKPPASSPGFQSSMFAIPGVLGNQKPNKPPVSPGFGPPLPGLSSFGSPAGGLNTLPFMTGFMRPPPPNPMVFGNIFDGFEHPFSGLGSPYPNLGLMSRPKPVMFFQGGGNKGSPVLPPWLVPLIRSEDPSPP